MTSRRFTPPTRDWHNGIKTRIRAKEGRSNELPPQLDPQPPIPSLVSTTSHFDKHDKSEHRQQWSQERNDQDQDRQSSSVPYQRKHIEATDDDDISHGAAGAQNRVTSTPVVRASCTVERVRIRSNYFFRWALLLPVVVLLGRIIGVEWLWSIKSSSSASSDNLLGLYTFEQEPLFLQRSISTNSSDPPFWPSKSSLASIQASFSDHLGDATQQTQSFNRKLLLQWVPQIMANNLSCSRATEIVDDILDNLSSLFQIHERMMSSLNLIVSQIRASEQNMEESFHEVNTTWDNMVNNRDTYDDKRATELQQKRAEHHGYRSKIHAYMEDVQPHQTRLTKYMEPYQRFHSAARILGTNLDRICSSGPIISSMEVTQPTSSVKEHVVSFVETEMILLWSSAAHQAQFQFYCRSAGLVK